LKLTVEKLAIIRCPILVNHCPITVWQPINELSIVSRAIFECLGSFSTEIVPNPFCTFSSLHSSLVVGLAIGEKPRVYRPIFEENYSLSIRLTTLQKTSKNTAIPEDHGSCSLKNSLLKKSNIQVAVFILNNSLSIGYIISILIYVNVTLTRFLSNQVPFIKSATQHNVVRSNNRPVTMSFAMQELTSVDVPGLVPKCSVVVFNTVDKLTLIH